MAATAALVIAQLLIVVVFDLPNLWLRVSTLFIPIPFAYVAARTSGHGFGSNFCFAVVVSVVSVLTMSAAVSMVDGTSIVPESRFSVVEFLQYVASIVFSFSTGLLLGGSLGRAAIPIVRWFLNAREVTPELLQQKMETAHKILTSLAAIGTTVASIVTGLHTLISK